MRIRLLALVTLIAFVAGPNLASAGESVAFQLDLSAAIRTDAGIAESPPKFRLFSNEWNVEAIEKTVIRFDDCTGRRPPKSEIPLVSDLEMFSGMWTSTANFDSTAGYCRIETQVAVLQPPFDTAWLLDDCWPRTRCYLGGKITDAESFGIALASCTGRRSP